MIERDQYPMEDLAKFQIDKFIQYGDSIALIDAKTTKQYTYNHLVDRIQRLADGLHKAGLRQGDVLCAFTFNTIEYPIIWYAVNYLGATFQTASPLYTDDELERRFSECSTKYIVTVSSLAPRISAIITRMVRENSLALRHVNTVIVIGETSEYIPYESLFSNKTTMKCSTCNPSTTASVLMSSSGTTGLPKCVQLSHVNIIANMMQIIENTQILPGMCTIITVPMFHHFGLHAALGTGLFAGLKIVVMERFDVKQFLFLVQQYKAEYLQMVPTMAARLVKSPDRPRYDLSTLRFIHTGGAPLGIGLERKLAQMFDLKFIGNAYGSTEAGHTSGNMYQRYRIGSCGIVPSGVHVKVVDIQTGEVLPANKQGEIHIGGKQVTIGYLKNLEANRTSFDENGYFITGDIGYMDEDGYLYIVDRLKELIKFRGFQVHRSIWAEDNKTEIGNQSLEVAPAYLENLLVKHPAILDAAVVGVPHAEDGELPKAYVVVKHGGQNITAKEIMDYVEEHVSSYMRLRGGVEFISQIPRNPSGKILRRYLREGGNKSKL